MNTPKVSVLMPAYNEEKNIVQAIESILAQTFQDFELIIIDDGSSDKTWEIMSDYAGKDQRIKVLKNEKNLKICATRNRLLGLARGEYVAWQDADDISLPYRLEKQVELLDRFPEIGICGGFLEFFDENGYLSTRKYFPDDENLRKRVFRYSPVAQPGAMLRKELLKEVGFFDEALTQAEDLDLSLRIGSKAKFANLQMVVICYRVSSGSITVRALKDNLRQTLFIRMRASGDYGYKMNSGDRIMYFFTWLALFLPTGVIYWLFNLIRNNK